MKPRLLVRPGPAVLQKVEATATGTGVTATLPVTPKQGNLLVACWVPRTSFANSTKDAAYTVADHGDRATTMTTYICYRVAGAAESPSFTGTSVGSVVHFVHLFEVANMTSPVLDQHSAVDGGAAAVSTLALPSITPTADDAFVVACVGTGNTPAQQLWGWTEGLTAIRNALASTREGVGYKRQPVAAAIAPTATWTTAQIASGVIASFRST